MGKTVFLFSGQGSQYAGMAKEFYDNFDSAKKVFETADAALGYKLEDIVFAEDPAELNKTVHSQPAIMACSLCAFEALREKGVEFDGVAGHSLGEYAAMAASGMLSYEDAFKLIKIRAEAMQKAAESSEGVMYAIIGPEPSEIEAACEQTEGYVVPVNYNSPVQTVIAGEASAADAAAELIKSTSKAKRVKAVKLNVASAFHSEIMRPAADEFLAKTEGFTFAQPKVSFFSNVTGGELSDFSDMRNMLAKHIVSPVKFTSELSEMQSQGYDKFIECGPGKVLTGLVKKTLDGATALNVENIETLEKALEG
ncbi:[acyl-carrier-protein] S-malonyltransferase [Ruminococcus sp. YE71]|uniref:ACP S-malonyltransferase n=1 Tax=unclassified Ruminococcus TaxID=2608920 RepID=UPI000891614C|nr:MULTISPECIES: ACP S-malonyltransferase [unclassified Ruminococcus]SDA17197.1 [acyl-carrier-protein] S-malonyltransferase [Ruminococcus sp. YE78]SFW26458.1 [acyl-carrier-protein] S-malonyltransferase [Ruminococcus sp. YE71]